MVSMFNYLRILDDSRLQGHQELVISEGIEAVPVA